MNENKLKSIPADGWLGFKQNFKSDAVSGFVVFLLALPLSLGIAKASDFPPIMGLITAIIGGILVSFLMGSKLTIKGPAAGLIVIVAGAVAEFGQGDPILGWKLALGALVVAGLIQILFGLLKFGKFVDFFPLSAIHGMLAAIGIIIIAKQIPVLLNEELSVYKGLSPIELLLHIPEFIRKLDPKAATIGVVSLLIMLGWPFIKNKKIKLIPAPLVVLAFAIPFEYFVVFENKNVSESLVVIGNLIDHLAINVNFEGVFQTSTFVKYVFMFAIVGTLESLLTVKAIDSLDPYKRKSDANQDIIAVGIGNTLAAFLGGLPMISEVARSSANVNNGAKTRCANFFHGFFILVFVLVAAPFLELIPNAALAAMLISVGIKLAHPQEFIDIFKIGKDQLVIFVVTIVFTLLQDILVGIFAGIAINIVFHIANGVPILSLFQSKMDVLVQEKNYKISIKTAAIFTNYLEIKNKLEQIPAGFDVVIDLKNTRLVDHSVMESLTHFKNHYETQMQGTFSLVGLEDHISFSKHPLSVKKKMIK